MRFWLQSEPYDVKIGPHWLKMSSLGEVNWISTIHLCKGVQLYLCKWSSLPFWTKLAFWHFFVCCYLPLTVNSLFTGVAQSGKKPKLLGRHNFDLKNFYFSICFQLFRVQVWKSQNKFFFNSLKNESCSSVLLKVCKSQKEILQFSQKWTENFCPIFQKVVKSK